MIVRSLHVENLLTFDDFHLELNGKSHTIVGPNGAGKSNMVRAIDLLTKAVDHSAPRLQMAFLSDAAAQALRSFAGARHHGQGSDQPVRVSLEFELTTAQERERMGTFIRATIASTLIENARSGDQEIPESIARWVELEATDEKLSAFWRPTLRMEHRGPSHLPWEVGCDFVRAKLPVYGS